MRAGAAGTMCPKCKAKIDSAVMVAPSVSRGGSMVSAQVSTHELHTDCTHSVLWCGEQAFYLTFDYLTICI